MYLYDVKTGIDAIGYFKDVQTGDEYWAYVKLTPIPSCIATLTGKAGAQAVFHVYHMK